MPQSLEIMGEAGQEKTKFWGVERFGLLALGSYLLFVCSDVWYRLSPPYSNPSLTLLGPWFCLVAGLTLLAAGAASKKPKVWELPGFVVLLLTQWLLQLVWASNEVGYAMPSDTVAFSIEAAILTLLGENPYGYPMNDAFSNLDAMALASTPRLDGGTVELLAYPALHFLVLLPVATFGVAGTRFVYNICHSLLLILIFRKAPSPYRLLALIPLLANPEFSRYPLVGSSDPVWVLLLALMIWQWKNPLVRGLLFGLACAHKQTPWVLAPFLFLRLVQEDSPKEAARFTLLSLGSFGLVNLYFIVQGPGEWLRAIFDPVISPMVPYGRGLSLLTQTNIVPFERSYYAVLLVSFFLCLLWAYWVNFERLRHLIWLAPAVLLFFSFRSLQHYFIYSVPLLILDWAWDGSERPTKPWNLAPMAGLMVSFTLVTLLFWPGPQQVRMDVLSRGPNPHQLSEFQLRVSNDSPRVIEPRFFSRPDWHVYPWTIASGPDQLAPGTSGTYEIQTDLSFQFLSARHGGLVFMSDARSPHRYLASASVEMDAALRSPRDQEPPPNLAWSTQGVVTYERDSVEFQTEEHRSEARLSRQIVVPEYPISFEVFRPELWSEQAQYTLEISSGPGQPRLSVYFTDQASKGYFKPSHYFKCLEAPKGAWTPISLDVKKLYSEAGFELPPLERRAGQDVEVLDRFLNLSFGVRALGDEQRVALRGLQTPSWPMFGRIARHVQKKSEYSALLGDLAVRRRQYGEALKRYRLAGRFDHLRRVKPLAPYFVGVGRLDVRENYSHRKKFRILADGESPLRFQWDPPTSFELKHAGQSYRMEKDSDWRPPRRGLLDLTLIPDREAKLVQIAESSGPDG